MTASTASRSIRLFAHVASQRHLPLTDESHDNRLEIVGGAEFSWADERLDLATGRVSHLGS
jgi:hypothetical protein